MKLLKVGITNSAILSDDFELNLTAIDNVRENDEGVSVGKLCKNLHTLNVNVLAGINASGKTTTLLVLEFALEIFLRGSRLTSAGSKFFLQTHYNGLPLEIRTWWYDEVDKCIYLLHSTIVKKETEQEKVEYEFESEVIYKKSRLSSETKKSILNFSEVNRLKSREEYDELIMKAMSKVNSIFCLFCNSEKPFIGKSCFYKGPESNVVEIKVTSEYSMINEYTRHVITLLDDKIENITFLEDTQKYQIFFKRGDMKIVDESGLNNILSSGTKRGYRMLRDAFFVLREGSYLLVDEIENHLHLSIVKMIVTWFENRSLNKYNAQIIFTTHYVEILDLINRKDSINILSTNENYKISINNFSNNVDRQKNDFSRRAVFESGKVNTNPKFSSKNNLERFMIEVMRDNHE